jgi:hypothetical protein
MSRSKPHLVVDSGAHIIRKSRMNISSTIVPKLLQETSYKATILYFLSLYPKTFGYSLGGYSHRERWPHTR